MFAFIYSSRGQIVQNLVLSSHMQQTSNRYAACKWFCILPICITFVDAFSIYVVVFVNIYDAMIKKETYRRRTPCPVLLFCYRAIFCG